MIAGVDINLIECCNCHVLFWITKEHDLKLQENKKTFYCPSGHAQSYSGKTSAELLKEEKEKVARYENYLKKAREDAEAERRKVNAYKGQVTKLKKKYEPEKFEEAKKDE